MKRIDGNILLASIKEGGRRVIELRKELNTINVFPIADADTGNNLASLMRSINEIESSESLTIPEVLKHIAKNALEGGKGNSGMIFAQYLNGIYRFYSHNDNDESQLIYSFESAVQDAYGSVQNPQEGTILTVMKTWATTLRELNTVKTIREALIEAREEAKKALLQTKNQHKIMKKYNVVDAGAKGFYTFVDGMTDVLIGNINQSKTDIIETDYNYIDKYHINDNSPNNEYRYCMEITLDYNSTNVFDTTKIEMLGDSIVVARGESKTRVHLHTNQPKKVIDSLQNQGTISKIKVDDMIQQHYDNHINKKSIAIVTDSIADVPKSVIEQYNIHILPLTILINETEHLDKITIDNQKLTELVDEGSYDISTSLPTQTMILRFLENLELGYESVLVICVSSALSGTYSSVKNTISNYQGNLNIKIVDSKLNSIAQGLLVKSAVEYVDAGLLFNDVVEKVETTKGNIKIYVSVSDLNPMIQSGRIPQKLGRLFKKMKLKPIVTLDKEGNGKLTSIGFTVKQNQKLIRNRILKRKAVIDDILIGYTTDKEDAASWSKIFYENNIMPVEITETSSIIALSAGKLSTAVAIKYKSED